MPDVLALLREWRDVIELFHPRQECPLWVATSTGLC